MVVLAIALYLFFKPSLTAIDTVVKIAAVIVGGAWTYLNYVRGRTYSRRLELAVSGEELNPLPNTRPKKPQGIAAIRTA